MFSVRILSMRPEQGSWQLLTWSKKSQTWLSISFFLHYVLQNFVLRVCRYALMSWHFFLVRLFWCHVSCAKKCFCYMSLASCGVEGTGTCTYLNGKCCHSLQKQKICKQCSAENCQHTYVLQNFALTVFAIMLLCLQKNFPIRLFWHPVFVLYLCRDCCNY